MGIELTNVYGLTESGNAGIMLTPADHAEAVRRAGAFGVSIGADAVPSLGGARGPRR